MKQFRDLASVGVDPGDVAASREGPELGPASEFRGLERPPQGKKIEFSLVV